MPGRRRRGRTGAKEFLGIEKGGDLSLRECMGERGRFCKVVEKTGVLEYIGAKNGCVWRRRRWNRRFRGCRWIEGRWVCVPLAEEGLDEDEKWIDSKNSDI